MKEPKAEVFMRFVWIFLTLLVFLRVVLVSRPNYQNKTIQVTGIVNKDPKFYGTKQLIMVNSFSFLTSRENNISFGDKITVRGVVEGTKITNPQVLTVRQQSNAINRLRQLLLTVYAKTLPPHDAGLVAGMVLGSKSLMPQSIWEKVINSGTAHVVVASGTNVTLLAGALMAPLFYVTKRPKAVLLVIIAIWFYALLCSLEAPIVRASLMSTIVFLGIVVGRKVNVLRIFLLSFLFMLLLKPFWFYDLGFWLSYLATLAILLFSTKIRSYLMFLPTFVRDNLATTLSAQIGVTPILVFIFHKLNVLSPIINALILPVVPTITVLGAFGGLLGLINLKLGEIVLYLVIPFTRWFLLWV